MQVMILAGFLGSGKTTLLLEVIRQLTQDPAMTVAVIENEVGAVGVDTSIIGAESRLPVREIVSGCIFCSLRVDLVQTLLALERDCRPDVVLLEPSGVASPAQVLRALDGYSGEIESRQTLTIVDVSRFQRITDLSIPLVRDGLDVASHVLVTKTDLVAEEQLEDVLQRITRARPDVPVISLDATDESARGRAVATVLRTMAAVGVRNDTAPAMAKTPDEEPPTVSAVVSTLDQDVAWAPDLDDGALGRALAELVGTMGRDAETHGADLIGHIKAVLKTPGGGYIFASVTGFGREPCVRGRLPRRAYRGTLTVNAIVYGIDRDRLAAVGRDAVALFADTLARKG